MSFRDELVAEPWRFDLLATLRRLEREHPDRPRIGDSATLKDEFVTIAQNPYLDFPASNLDAAELRPSERLADKIARKISQSIALGEYGEGSRLPTENDLAAHYGVSRPVIREALTRLRDQGLIVSRRGSGSYVRAARFPLAADDDVRFAPIGSFAEVRKCFEFRVTVEGDAAYHAALNRTPQALIAMQSALKKLETEIVAGKLGISPDFEFHLAVSRASENEFFETAMKMLGPSVEFTINLARSL